MFKKGESNALSLATRFPPPLQQHIPSRRFLAISFDKAGMTL